MNFTIEVEREEDGRWIAEVMDLPGTLVYGKTRKAALTAVEALALRVMADRIEHGEVATPENFTVSFSTAPSAA
jgi:predicted RNase H-like HicB family nuclease